MKRICDAAELAVCVAIVPFRPVLDRLAVPTGLEALQVLGKLIGTVTSALWRTVLADGKSTTQRSGVYVQAGGPTPLTEVAVRVVSLAYYSNRGLPV